MPAGLINIISYGANDLFLTGAPQITFFKIIYRRYTNFSTESVNIPIDNLDFGTTVETILPKTGDLLGQIYLQIKLPCISILRSDLGIDISPVINNTYQDNYDIVLQFMTMNTAAYRVAVSDSMALSLPPIVMINDIINVFGTFSSAPIVISSYDAILINANLEPSQSNIAEIANNILADLMADPSSWTTAQIMNAINLAIQFSIQVQGFFYNQLLTYNDTYNSQSSSYAQFAWVEKLGHSIIDYIDVNIGGEKIDRHYGYWIDIWYELAGNKTQQNIYNQMIGNVPKLTIFDQVPKPSYLLSIPLSFWFCKNSGLALPLIALRYNDVSITVKLRSFEDCAYVEKPTDPDIISLTDIWQNNGYLLDCNLLVDYVYLDTLERKRFAQSAHEYLVERTQDMFFDNIDKTTTVIELDFRSPTKEIIWITQKSAYINNNVGYLKNLWTNYGLDSHGIGNPIIASSMTLNGYDRLLKMDGNYYNYVIPYSHHTNIPKDGINVFSFSIYPEEYQPSSTCNFSRIDSTKLYLHFDESAFYYEQSDIDPSITPIISNPISPFPAVWQYSKIPSEPDIYTASTTLQVRIFATCYNILRIIGGMGALAYY